ncbi:hypothetical protein [uncultured Flavobacterium sp.]|uniref:hypothetical protein n=1 Tax=uncultured Flavobacterium sp. TaxID=165435 RepID=UPI0030ECA3D5|tara:strand:- start:1557 stop:1802 length:246 start_codon:yes stop_codon:yes gene_type:complete
MKILGYVLKGISLYFILVIILFSFNLLFEDLPSDVVETNERIGYRLGQVIVILLASFLTYLLFKYSNKLIRKKSNQVEVKQ